MYEWRFVKYGKCGMFGYFDDGCKKGLGLRVWEEKDNCWEYLFALML